MPRTRLVALIWLFGVLVLLGAWGSSLFRKSLLRYQMPRKGTALSLAIVGGSVEFVRSPIRSRDKNRLAPHIYEIKEGSIPPPVPAYKLGRFHHERREVKLPGKPNLHTVYEFPIWILIPPWTLLCLLPWRHYHKRRRQPPDLPDAAASS